MATARSETLPDWAMTHLVKARAETEGPWVSACCPGHEDSSPSFRLNTETGGWTCLAACGSGNIWELARQLGLPAPPDRPGWEPAGAPEAETVYVYRTADGAPYSQAVRKPGKKFKQARWEGGKWVWKAPERTLPYHLPELHSVTTVTVFWVEGEKDADRAAALGLLATTSPGGCKATGKLSHEALEVLRGRSVVVIPDNDQPGRQYAEVVVARLKQAGAEVRQLDLAEHWPEVPAPKGGDLSDWLDAGGTREQLLELVCATAHTEQDGEIITTPGEAAQPFSRTELGNAQLLIARFGNRLRYVATDKTWLVHDGRVWKADTCQAGHLANQVALGRLELAGDDKAERNWAFKSHSTAVRNGTLAQAATIPGVQLLRDELDSDPWLFNVQNGTLDLRTGTLRPHDPADLLSKLAPIPYDAAATCPLWERFLDRIMGGDRAMVSFLQRACGYAITGSATEQVVFFLHGRGANGKSTFLEAFLKVIGPYGRRADAETFLLSKKSGPREDLLDLKGARTIVATEANEGRTLDEALLKQFTGGDEISTRGLYLSREVMKPEGKLFFAFNDKPEIRSGGHSIWRRLLHIPFEVQITESERDKDLPFKLSFEAAGILAWAVRGCREWQDKGLQAPDCVRNATRNYEEEQDQLGQWIADRCVLAPMARVGTSELYANYSDWAGRDGLSQVAFGRKLAKRPHLSQARSAVQRYWLGIGLRDHEMTDESVTVTDSCDGLNADNQAENDGYYSLFPETKESTNKEEERHDPYKGEYSTRQNPSLRHAPDAERISARQHPSAQPVTLEAEVLDLFAPVNDPDALPWSNDPCPRCGMKANRRRIPEGIRCEACQGLREAS